MGDSVDISILIMLINSILIILIIIEIFSENNKPNQLPKSYKCGSIQIDLYKPALSNTRNQNRLWVTHVLNYIAYEEI